MRETRAHLAFALRPSGERVLANVLHIAELARKYEANGGLSFRGFVEELRFGGDAIKTGEAPIFEEGSEGIRMMSVHKAKGLEFPIVILADITAKLCLPRPDGHIDSARSLCAVWRAECAYNQPDDYVFASIKMHGKQPIWPNSAMEDHIRPAAKRAGITKRIGWHTLRHTFGTLLKANGEDVATVQALMRHANVSVTTNNNVQA